MIENSSLHVHVSVCLCKISACIYTQAQVEQLWAIQAFKYAETHFKVTATFLLTVCDTMDVWRYGSNNNNIIV